MCGCVSTYVCLCVHVHVCLVVCVRVCMQVCVTILQISLCYSCNHNMKCMSP